MDIIFLSPGFAIIVTVVLLAILVVVANGAKLLEEQQPMAKSGEYESGDANGLGAQPKLSSASRELLKMP